MPLCTVCGPIASDHTNARCGFYRAPSVTVMPTQGRITVTRSPGITVTPPPISIDAPKRRGRPPSGAALTPAEKQRAYRDRRRTAPSSAAQRA